MVTTVGDQTGVRGGVFSRPHFPQFLRGRRRVVGKAEAEAKRFCTAPVDFWHAICAGIASAKGSDLLRNTRVLVDSA